MGRTFSLTTPAMHGKDIEILQERLNGLNPWKKNFNAGKSDGQYGPTTAKAVKSAKWFLGYPSGACTPMAGDKLAGFLSGKVNLPLLFRARMKQRAQAARPGIRDAILAECKWGINHTPQIHYQQVRPMPLKGWKARNLPLTTDCSGSITCIFFTVGAPDPNGLKYSGQGYTGTMLQHLTPISRANAKVGDLVVFGSYPGEHVVCLMEPGSVKDPLVFSHGQEAGPFSIRLSTETSAHGGAKVTFLSAGV